MSFTFTLDSIFVFIYVQCLFLFFLHSPINLFFHIFFTFHTLLFLFFELCSVLKLHNNSSIRVSLFVFCRCYFYFICILYSFIYSFIVCICVYVYCSLMDDGLLACVSLSNWIFFWMLLFKRKSFAKLPKKEEQQSQW